MVCRLDDEMYCCTIVYTTVTQYVRITQHFARVDDAQLVDSSRKLIGTCTFQLQQSNQYLRNQQKYTYSCLLSVLLITMVSL